MNILITAGGTAEKIDDVRAITNTGTGTLGSIIADRFAEADSANNVIYVCSRHAVRPSARVEVFVADDTEALEYTVREICESRKIDAVIHSMAVSDYRVKTVTDSYLLAERVAEEVRLLGPFLPAGSDDIRARDFVELILNPPPLPDRGKIRSDHEDLVVILEKTPKIISMLRGLLPNAVLVGFKLLSNASLDELLAEGRKTLASNGCDFVLANDMTTVGAGKHAGYLIGRDGTYSQAEGKEAIAEVIVGAVYSATPE
jgi:phosphopantothenate-cysteine ligase